MILFKIDTDDALVESVKLLDSFQVIFHSWKLEKI